VSIVTIDSTVVRTATVGVQGPPGPTGATGATGPESLPAGSLKAHRTAAFTFALANTWTNLPLDTLVEAETNGGVAFTDATQDTLEFTWPGLWYCSGCVRPLYTGAGNPSIITATRIVLSDDAGVTWRELRCLQSVFGRARGQDEPGTERYSGTIAASVGTLIRLQARSSDAALTLTGWVGFDNPVSASLELHSIQRSA
jgi:hypothetical protein